MCEHEVLEHRDALCAAGLIVREKGLEEVDLRQRPLLCSGVSEVLPAPAPSRTLGHVHLAAALANHAHDARVRDGALDAERGVVRLLRRVSAHCCTHARPPLRRTLSLRKSLISSYIWISIANTSSRTVPRLPSLSPAASSQWARRPLSVCGRGQPAWHALAPAQRSPTHLAQAAPLLARQPEARELQVRLDAQALVLSALERRLGDLVEALHDGEVERGGRRTGGGRLGRRGGRDVVENVVDRLFTADKCSEEDRAPAGHATHE